MGKTVAKLGRVFPKGVIMKTSIVFTAFSANIHLAELSMATLANIYRYTDPEEYELIIIDNIPKSPIRDDYKVMDLEKLKAEGRYIINNPDIGYAASMNQGARIATGEYLLFMENDIFVYENWLKDLRYYLENNLCDVIVPNQVPSTRSDILKWRQATHEELMHGGIQEQGMIMFRRQQFIDKGLWWNEKLFKWLPWAEMPTKISRAGLMVRTTLKVTISHFTAATVYYELENRNPQKDAELAIEDKYREDKK